MDEDDQLDLTLWYVDANGFIAYFDEEELF